MIVNQPQLLLKSESDGLATQTSFSVDFKLPKMADIGISAKAVQQATVQGKNALQLLTIVNVVVALVMHSSFDDIWVVLNTVSILIYLPIFNLRFPDLPSMLLGAMSSLITFDIFETINQFTREHADFEFLPRFLTPTPAYNDSFEDNNFEIGNTFLLLSSVNILILYLIGSMLFCILSRLWCWQKAMCCKKTQKSFSFKSQIHSWNRLLITGFLELFICTLVPLLKPQDSDEPNLLSLDWSDLNTQDKLSLVYGLVLLGWLTLLTVSYVFAILYLAPKLHVVVLHDKRQEVKLSLAVYALLVKQAQTQDKLKKGQEEQDQLNQSLEEEDIAISKSSAVEDQALPRQYQTNQAPKEVEVRDSTVINLSRSQILVSEPDLSQDFGACNEIQKLNQDSPKSREKAQSASNEALGDPKAVAESHEPSQEASQSHNDTLATLLEDVKEVEKKIAKRREASLKFDEMYRSAALLSPSKIETRMGELLIQLKKLDKRLGEGSGQGLTRFQASLKSYFELLFHGLKYDQQLTLYYYLVYILRRSLLIYAIFFLSQYPQIQIISAYVDAIAALVFLMGARPYQLLSQTRLELFNELCVLCCVFLTLFIFMAQRMIKDEEEAIRVSVETGNGFAAALLFCLIVNFLRISCNQCSLLKQKLIRKKNIFVHESKLYDAKMNAGRGAKICDCRCSQCSAEGHKHALKHTVKASYGPVQDFAISLHECGRIEGSYQQENISKNKVAQEVSFESPVQEPVVHQQDFEKSQRRVRFLIQGSVKSKDLLRQSSQSELALLDSRKERRQQERRQQERRQQERRQQESELQLRKTLDFEAFERRHGFNAPESEPSDEEDNENIKLFFPEDLEDEGSGATGKLTKQRRYREWEQKPGNQAEQGSAKWASRTKQARLRRSIKREQRQKEAGEDDWLNPMWVEREIKQGQQDLRRFNLRVSKV